MTRSLSAVVCAYTEDRWDDLVAAIESLRAQQPKPLEIILVIDYNESLLERSRSLGSDVAVMANSGPRGLSGARNTGVAAAVGDVVAFLDDDAAARTGWVAGMLGWYQDLDVIGVGGYVEPKWPEARPSWFPREFDWVVGCSYVGLPTTIASIRNPIGSSMSFRKSALDASAGFDTKIGRIGTIPLGCEETELTIRLQRAHAGSKVIFDPSIVVDHRVSAQRTKWSYFASRCWAEGLSKAVVRDRVGAGAALSSELRYVTHVLPMAVVRGAMTPMDGWRRAAAVVAGLALTAAGFVRGSFHVRSQR